MALSVRSATPRGAAYRGWAGLAIVLAVLVAGPLVALPLAFVTDPGATADFARFLPDALQASVILALGVGAGTLLVGGGLAALVSFYDFPGRRWIEWALVLPLAMPAYVLVFVLLGQYDATGAAQRALRAVLGDGAQLPEVRSTLGTIVVLTAVLYPYVYILGRSAFLEQPRDTIESARALGISYGRAVLRVAVPLARPALAAGAGLAVMEALADFGAVNLLNYRAMTDAIYRVWYGAFDQAAALQLATVLLGLVLTLVALERLARGKARHTGAMARGEAVTPRRLRGPAGLAAAFVPSVLIVVVVGLPLAQLVAWAIQSLDEGAAPRALLEAAVRSLALASLAALVATTLATTIVHGRRMRPSVTGAVAARLGTIGYAVPGTVVAIAVYIPLAWVDRRLDDVLGVGLLFTGSILGLVAAYVVRFNALSTSAVAARMARIDPELDDAARSLGADRSRLLAEVHLPLLWPGMLTAALLVFVETLKELPATALLRPLGGDTLAIAVWEGTKDSRYDTAALPALVIVLVGLVPVIAAVRLLRARTEPVAIGADPVPA